MWSCSTCGHDNELDAPSCAVCNASFEQTMTNAQVSPHEPDPNKAALYSLLLPGAGHAYLGLVGQAVARAVMSVWVVGVTLIALFSDGGRTGALVWTTYGCAAVALWLAAAHDAYREAGGQPALVLLSGRRFLYVTLALIGVLFLVMTVGAMGARGSF